MNKDDANLIAAKYGELLLERGLSIMVGAKVSLLDASIEDIKTALKILMKAYYSEGDNVALNGLWRSYFSLAYFVVDKYVTFSKEVEEKLDEIDKIERNESNIDLLKTKFGEVLALVPADKRYFRLVAVIDAQKKRINQELDDIRKELGNTQFLDLEEAGTIVRNFIAFLEKHPLKQPTQESLLPYPKYLIKEGLKVLMQNYSSAGKFHEVGVLMDGFILLMFYLPDYHFVKGAKPSEGALKAEEDLITDELRKFLRGK